MAAKTEINQRFHNMSNGGLDIVGFYLDDGAVAGNAEAVRFFCDRLKSKLAEIGLEFRPDKSQVIPSVLGTELRLASSTTFGIRRRMAILNPGTSNSWGRRLGAGTIWKILSKRGSSKVQH